MLVWSKLILKELINVLISRNESSTEKLTGPSIELIYLASKFLGGGIDEASKSRDRFWS